MSNNKNPNQTTVSQKAIQHHNRAMRRVSMTIWTLVAASFVAAAVVWWLLLRELP